jgi:hypothetical protein
MAMLILYLIVILIGIFKFPNLTLAFVLLNNCNYSLIFLPAGIVALLAAYVPRFKMKGSVKIDMYWDEVVSYFKKFMN